MRPLSHFRRFQVASDDIVKSLRAKIETGTFQTLTLSRQRQQYWYRGFLKQANRLQNSGNSLKDAFESLLTNGIILVTHSLKYFVKVAWADTPHHIFALTPICDTG